jgi:hypothetical protein
MEDQSEDSTHNDWLYCNTEHFWYHRECLKVTKEQFAIIDQSDDPYKCPRCVERDQPEQQPAVRPVPGGKVLPTNNDDENNDPSSQESLLLRPSHEPISSSSDSSSDEEVIEQQVDRPATRGAPRQMQPSGSGTTRRSTARKSTAAIDKAPSRRSRSTVSTEAVDPLKDSDGYAEIKDIIGHKGAGPKREFQVMWTDDTIEWVKEKDCDGCVYQIKLYCRAKNLPAPTIKYRKGCGHADDNEEVEEAWASIGEILGRAHIYGDKDSLQAVEFRDRPNEDAILAMQIGNHCFVILYYHSRNIAIIADGSNAYQTDSFAQRCIKMEFEGVNLINIPFHGQNKSNRCASSAAIIIIEFQKYYNRDLLPTEIVPTKVVFERVQRSIHKVETTKTVGWTPINMQKFGITVRWCSCTKVVYCC